MTSSGITDYFAMLSGTRGCQYCREKFYLHTKQRRRDVNIEVSDQLF